jgi:hypothetical protein
VKRILIPQHARNFAAEFLIQKSVVMDQMKMWSHFQRQRHRVHSVPRKL